MGKKDEKQALRLFGEGPAADAKAPILVIHFDGALDAGASGSLAVLQMLRSLGVRRVATFDSDQLIDYRSHRPVMTVEDWVSVAVEAPEIALDLVHDDRGNPLLLLHGPEPDAKWETFAANVTELAQKAGVEISFSLSGVPAGVPHTRTTPVHVRATDAALLPDQPQMGGSMQFPAPMSAFVQQELSKVGIEGMSLMAAVPYYMADNPFPKGASALLERLSDSGDLALPRGDLERAALEELEQVNEAVATSEDVQRAVKALEGHYDAMMKENASATLPLPERRPGDEEVPSISDMVEAYLAQQTKERSEEEAAAGHIVDGQATTETVQNPSQQNRPKRGTVEDAFARLRALQEKQNLSDGGSASPSDGDEDGSSNPSGDDAPSDSTGTPETPRFDGEGHAGRN